METESGTCAITPVMVIYYLLWNVLKEIWGLGLYPVVLRGHNLLSVQELLWVCALGSATCEASALNPLLPPPLPLLLAISTSSSSWIQGQWVHWVCLGQLQWDATFIHSLIIEHSDLSKTLAQWEAIETGTISVYVSELQWKTDATSNWPTPWKSVIS